MEPKKNKVGILVDMDRCVGCYACEVACRQENREKGDKKSTLWKLDQKT